LEHLSDVVEEFFADLFGTRVVLEVVVALGEGESAGGDVEDDLFRVLGVAVGEETVGGDVGKSRSAKRASRSLAEERVSMRAR
jgi:hypothetical protein